MEFNEYQEAAFVTAEYPNKKSNIYYPAMGLGSEAGEVLGKIKKIMRDDNGVTAADKRQAIKDELGDVLWYVAALASELSLKMEDIATSNITKLYDRQKRGVIKGSGDNR